MTKAAKKFDVLVLGVAQETDKAVELEVLVQTRAGDSVRTAWFPKSALTWKGDMLVEVPAWKVRDVEAQLSNGDLCFLKKAPA